MKKFLLVGESWVSSATHYKGWDQFSSTTFHLGAEDLLKAVNSNEIEITYMPAHEAAEKFPSTLSELKKYHGVIFSDIGSNTILLHPKVWIDGEVFPNRLDLVKEYVELGGAFMMVGGYLSFQGINGAARFRGTAIEEILPVNILPYDDRIEIPQGFSIEVGPSSGSHTILQGLEGKWPPLLGINEVTAKEGANQILQIPEKLGSHPLLVEWKFSKGKTIVWTSDIGPHWVSKEFLNWEGYSKLWNQIFHWMAQ